MLLSLKALCQPHIRYIQHFRGLAQSKWVTTSKRGQPVKVEGSMWGEVISKSAFEMFWPLVSGQVLTTLLQHLTSPLIPPPPWSVTKNSLKTMGKEMMWILLPVAHALMMRPEPTPTLTLAHLYLPGCSLFINKQFFIFILLWQYQSLQWLDRLTLKANYYQFISFPLIDRLHLIIRAIANILFLITSVGLCWNNWAVLLVEILFHCRQ